MLDIILKQNNSMCNVWKDAVNTIKATSNNPVCKSTTVTVDSGACVSIAPPHAFPNTVLHSKNAAYGKIYGACGGEAVRNVGEKRVEYDTK